MEKRQFLEPEHWRQLIPIIATIVFPIVIFMGVLWADHGQVAATTAAVSEINRQLMTVQHDIIEMKTHLAYDDQTSGQLGTQLENLRSSVSNLTLAVQKLTDLLPERSK